MPRSWRSYALTLTLLCGTSTGSSLAFAQDGGVRLGRGEPAPFSGVLLTVEDAVLPAVELEKCEESRAQELARLEERHKLQTELAAVQAATDREAMRLQLSVLQEDRRSLRKRLDAWYRSPILHVAIGAAVGIALTLAVFQIASEMENP
jgi:hypothetical protein